MYKVRTTYKDNDLAVETYEYSLVYDEEDKEILGRYEGWL